MSEPCDKHGAYEAWIDCPLCERDALEADLARCVELREDMRKAKRVAEGKASDVMTHFLGFKAEVERLKGLILRARDWAIDRKSVCPWCSIQQIKNTDGQHDGDCPGMEFGGITIDEWNTQLPGERR